MRDRYYYQLRRGHDGKTETVSDLYWQKYCCLEELKSCSAKK